MTDITFQELRTLNAFITSSLDSIESTLQARGQQFPSPSQPFTPETEAPRNAPDVMVSCQILTAAATQLIAAVRPPGITAITTATQVRVLAYCSQECVDSDCMYSTMYRLVSIQLYGFMSRKFLGREVHRFV